MSITVNKISLMYIQGVQFNKFKITFLFYFFKMSWDQHCAYIRRNWNFPVRLRLWKGIIEVKQYVWNAVKLSIPLFIVNCPNFSYFLPFFLKMIPTFSPTFYINAVGRPDTYIHAYMHACMHTYIHTYHTYIHTYIHTDIHITSTNSNAAFGE